MIPAYQNDLQMFPIFRMQFALLDDLCIPAIISCEKLDLRVNISECASYGAFSRNFYLALNATRQSPSLFDKMSVLSRMRLLYDTLTHQSKLEQKAIILPSSTIF